MGLFSKSIAFAFQKLFFWKVKPMLLHYKSYPFASQYLFFCKLNISIKSENRKSIAIEL